MSSKSSKRGFRSGERKTLKRKLKGKRTKKKSKQENKNLKKIRKSKKSKKSKKLKRKQSGGKKTLGDILNKDNYKKAGKKYFFGKDTRRILDKGSYITENLPEILNNLQDAINDNLQSKIQDQLTLYLFSKKNLPDILDNDTLINDVILKMNECGEEGKKAIHLVREHASKNNKQITNEIIWTILIEMAITKLTESIIEKSLDKIGSKLIKDSTVYKEKKDLLKNITKLSDISGLPENKVLNQLSKTISNK